MVIKIRHAEEADLPAVAALSVGAFKDTAYHQALWPSRLRTKPGVEEQLDHENVRMRRSLDSPSSQLVVADDAGRVVGFAEWIAPATGQPQTQTQTNKQKRAPPAGLDVDAANEGSEQIRAILESDECVAAFKGRDMRAMWTLNSIAVDEAYRGKGIGKQLTAWGVSQAEEKGQDIWLIAAPTGRALYDKAGFTEVARGARFGEGQYVMTKFQAASSRS